MSQYRYRYFAKEEDLIDLLQLGPAVTNVDVGPNFQFYGGGVFYDDDRCYSFEDEHVPYSCQTQDNGYTCLKECKEFLPAHCDRFFVPPTNETTYPHSVLIVGYSSDR